MSFTVESIQDAIDKAEKEESRLSPEALAVPSYSSTVNRHLLNNLGALATNYFEVGLHRGGTFISTLFDNTTRGIGCDNWSQFEEDGKAKSDCLQNAKMLLDPDQYVIRDLDCFAIDLNLLPTIDLYLYDGDHAEELRKRGLTYFFDAMRAQFVFICDDFNWPGPKMGTLSAISELPVRVLGEWTLFDGKEGGRYHNGLGIFLLGKI